MSRISAPISAVLALALALAPLSLGALGALHPVSATAADGAAITWSVEPTATPEGPRRAFDYSVNPGTQIVDSVVITNSGDTPAEFLIYATDAINERETGAFGLLGRDQKPTDSGSWITLASDKLTIQPGTQATVPFNLLVPSDATPGDHVAGIVAAVLTQGTQDGAAVTLEQRVGARLYLSVTGVPDAGVEAQGTVSGFAASLNPFAPGTVSVSYDVRNTGNLRLDVRQRIQVSGPFGIPLGSISPEPVRNLLPRQTVRVSAEVPAIVALALAWSTVTLEPGRVGTADTPLAGVTAEPSTASPTPTPTANAGAVATVADPVEFAPASSTVMTLAVSWTLLLLTVVVIAALYLIWRYLSSIRERLYDAIDEATAAAKQDALNAAAPAANVAAELEAAQK